MNDIGFREDTPPDAKVFKVSASDTEEDISPQNPEDNATKIFEDMIP